MPKQRGPASSPLFMLVASVTFVVALYYGKEILLPLGLAILLSFLLTPVANRLERWGLRRVPATLLVVVLLFAGLGVLGYIVTTQAIELSHKLPNYRTNVASKIHAVVPGDQLKKAFQTVDDLGSEVTLSQLHDWLGPVLGPFGTAGMVVVLVFFIMLDRENQRNRLLQLFGTSNLHATTEAMHDASHRVGRYLRMQFLVNACYGMAVGLGLSVIGVPAAVLWGVLGFSLRFVPYIGPLIAAALPILVSLGHFDGWTQPLLVVGWFVGLELVFNNAVEPWVYGSTTGVSVVGVILSALFWTWLWGAVGLILALPMTVCLVVAARYVPQLRFLTVLLADQPPMTPAERIYQRLLAFDYHEPVRLARKHLKEATLGSFYDEALIPALVLAEHDRHAELLNDDQETFIAEAAEDLVEELQEYSEARDAKADAEVEVRSAEGREPISARVMCVALRDQADEVAARMLAQLLAAEGFHVETGGAESLTSEIVERVAKHDIDVVVISILPPIMPRDSRLLWKRLRSRCPDLPIVVGFWSGTAAQKTISPPEDDPLSKVATTLADAVAQVRAIAAQQQLVAETG